MFKTDTYRGTHKRILGALSRPVVIRVNNGTSYTNHNAKAHVSNWSETELIAGGTIKTGDLRVIIDADEMPRGVTKLEQRDRIAIDGRDYSVIAWDAETRSIGDTRLAYEATVRG